MKTCMTTPCPTPILPPNGTLVRPPPGSGLGYWAGAPGVFRDDRDGTLYLTYRLRRPRGVSPDRGGEARIARSTDGIHFEDVWSVRKEAYSTASIERSGLARDRSGRWHYLTSYVDPTDGRWCVARLVADAPDRFDPATVERVLSAPALGLEGIKDPWILQHEGRHHLFVSVALPTPRTGEASHATHDIYNTGECLSATGLAVSGDLRDWTWVGVVFAPEGEGWDAYCRRINTVWPVEGGFLACYDGSASHRENYEEKTGLAFSTDLRVWKTLHPDAPCWTSPAGSGSLRYADRVAANGRTAWYYEIAREDGAHELRVAIGT